MKRLHKSRKSKVITGVCGGIAEYFNKKTSSPIEMPTSVPPPPSSTQEQRPGNTANLIIGVILIVVGFSFLLGTVHSIWSFWNWGRRFLIPGALIVGGLWILLFHKRP